MIYTSVRFQKLIFFWSNQGIDGLWAGRPGFYSRQGQINFLPVCTASRPAVGPTQPHGKSVAGAFSAVVKRPGREADHSPPSSAEVNNGGDTTPLPSKPS
jgi:hypothetical protein